MSVEYILDRFGKKVGMVPSDTSQRALLLDYLNEAAKELYEQFAEDKAGLDFSAIIRSL